VDKLNFIRGFDIFLIPSCVQETF